MGTEGEFQFSNGGLINYNTDYDRISPVSKHEAQHTELYSTTTFGQLTLMMEKNALFHEKSNWLYKELFTYMNRMQERISVNIEHLYIFTKRDQLAYLKAIEDLKIKNRTYYNYFKKLCCVNGKVKTEKEASNAIDTLRVLGRLALNVKIDEIPFETMTEPKDLKRFFSVESNAEKYLPNKRFDNIIDILFRKNNDNQGLALFLEGSIASEYNKYDDIHKIAESKAKKILRDSLNYDRLIKRIATVGVKELKIKCENTEYLLNLPLDLDRTDKVDIIIESVEEFLTRIRLDKNEKSVVFLQHSMGGFEDVHMVTLFDYHVKKAYSTGVVGDDIFYSLIKQIPQHIVFIQTKLFRKLKSKIRGMVQQLPIFITIECCIYYGIEFIIKNFSNGFFSFIHKDNYDVLVIWKRSYIFVGYINVLAKQELEKIFYEYNIKYISYEEAEIEKEYVEIVATSCMEHMTLSKNYLDNLKNSNAYIK